MYSISFDEAAIDFLNDLSKDTRKRIYDKIISTKENPFRYFERLSGRSDYRMRVGKYRVIADIRQDSMAITLIGNRKNIYKRH